MYFHLHTKLRKENMEIYKEIEKVVSKPDSHSISTLTGGNDLIVSQINAFGKRRLVEA